MQHYPKEMLDEIERLAKEYNLTLREAETYYLMGDLEQVKFILDIQKENNFKLTRFQLQCMLYDEIKNKKYEKMNQILKGNNEIKKKGIFHFVIKKLNKILEKIKFLYYRMTMERKD